MADTPAAATGGQGHSDALGMLTRKIGPLPVWAYAALLIGIYYWYEHYGPGATKAAAATAPASTIVVQGDGGGGGGQGPPGAPGAPGAPGTAPSVKNIVVPRNMTVSELAKYLHWTPAELAWVLAHNKTASGGEWTAGTKLKKGETVIRSLGGTTVTPATSEDSAAR